MNADTPDSLATKVALPANNSGVGLPGTLPAPSATVNVDLETQLASSITTLGTACLISLTVTAT